ncbi:MAG: helix-turn-helix domain-containing protein [Pseudomonadota bacterium]
MAIPEGDTVPYTRDEILTLDEVAAYLKAGKRTVYRLAQQGEIPAFKLGGTWRFRRSELDRWIAESINKTKPEAE